jgi:glucose/arabinose dehydrogenase
MHRRTLAAFGLAALLAAPALAQTPDMQRPPNMPDLRPHPPRLTVTPPDQVPTARLRVPEGFRVELWASGMPGIRAMVRGEGGTIFAGTRIIGRVYAIRDLGDRREGRVLVQGLTQPSGVAIRDGALYVSALSRMLRFDNIEANLDSPPQPVDLSAAFALPPETHHAWKHIQFGPDGRLYVPVGAPCNFCAVEENTHAVILRFNPDGTGREVVARGVRNTVGFDFHPETGQLWFTNHGRDWAGNDLPPDTLHVVTRIGAHHGFPYCVGDWRDPGIPGDRRCEEFQAPVAALGPHVAPIQTVWARTTSFPEAYRNRLFIALRGSWNRERLSGYEVVTVRFEGGRAIVEPFLTGLRDDAANAFHGRPAGLLFLPDGSLLVSDEQNGAIYRIFYAGR